VRHGANATNRQRGERTRSGIWRGEERIQVRGLVAAGVLDTEEPRARSNGGR
jgi:hypothetical protein